MPPYRPLFVVDESRDREPQELRGLAVLLIALGLLRIAPVLVLDEPVDSESIIAAAMIAIGASILLRLPCNWRRIRAGVARALARR